MVVCKSNIKRIKYMTKFWYQNYLQWWLKVDQNFDEHTENVYWRK